MTTATYWTAAACIAGTFLATKASKANTVSQQVIPEWQKAKILEQFQAIAEKAALPTTTAHPIIALSFATEAAAELLTLRKLFGDDLLSLTTGKDVIDFQKKLNDSKQKLTKRLHTVISTPVPIAPRAESKS